MGDPSFWTPLHAHVHQTLRQRQLLERGAHLLLAVSGGQDSLCVARVLLDLQPKWRWTLTIAHCDHRWPGDAGNPEFVRSIAAVWGLSYVERIAVVPDEREAAARAWRYQMLTEMAQDQGCVCVITGHTASDRAETLLFNLVRGSGMDGLQALVWQRSLAPTIRLVRPLLAVTRAETGQFCQELGLHPWMDGANQSRRYARSRLRQDVLPYFQTHFNPQVERTLGQTAELLQADVEYLENQASQLLSQAVAPEENCMHRGLLRAAHLALQRRALRQFLVDRLPSAMGFEHVEKLVALVNAPNGSQTDPFPGGAIARVEGDWIRLVPLER